MSKTYVVDTNVLLFDPVALTSFDEHDVLIPLVVFEELDRHKSRYDEVGRNARETCRLLDKLRLTGNLNEGIPIGTLGGSLRVMSLVEGQVDVPRELGSSVDNTIISCMLWLRKIGIDAKLISRDINMRLKCDGLGMKSEDYVKSNNIVSEDLYTGVTTLNVGEDLENKFLLDGIINVENYFDPNQIVILKNLEGKTFGISRNYVNDNVNTLKCIQKYHSVYGLKSRNKEQDFSLDLLMDPDVKLVTLTGKAGCVHPDTLVSIKLENINWELPEPVHTYFNVKSENEK